jgi:hypothetical protein
MLSADASAPATPPIHIGREAIQDWAANAVSPDTLRAVAPFGFAAALSLFASSSAAPGLRERPTAPRRSL